MANIISLLKKLYIICTPLPIYFEATFYIRKVNDVLALPRYACVDYGKMQGAFDAMDKMTDNAELDGQQLVVHSFMPKPDECIPADESTEIDVVIDSVSGKLSNYHQALTLGLWVQWPGGPVDLKTYWPPQKTYWPGGPEDLKTYWPPKKLTGPYLKTKLA